MAYFAKLGGVMRQSVARSMLLQNGAGAAALPAVYLLQRGMSSHKLFVGGLAWGTDETSLRDAFSSFGEVTEVKIICDRDTGRSRGFGFVSFSSDKEAEAALQEMDGRELAGRSIRVDYATERSGGGMSRGFGSTSGGYGGGSAYGGGPSGYGSGGGLPYGGGPSSGGIPPPLRDDEGEEGSNLGGSNWRGM